MNFVFDIDGTLCFNGQSIEQDILQAIDEVLAAGHKVIFASARPIRDLLPVLPERYHQLPLVGGNGAFTSTAGHIECVQFSEEMKERLFDLIVRFKVTYLADSDWDFSYTASREHPIYKHLNVDAAKNVPLSELQNLCKLVLFGINDAFFMELMQLPVVLTQYKGEQIYDISPLGVHKVRGLKQLGIDQYIAFGNDENDRSMFEHAVYSVCVGEQDVKEAAHCVISKLDVASTINDLVKKYSSNIIHK